jgi:hypothetical protein
VTRPANPIANIFQNAGNVKILSRGEKTGEGGRQKPFLPGSKTFAFLVPLRRCVKNDSGSPPAHRTTSILKSEWGWLQLRIKCSQVVAPFELQRPTQARTGSAG